MPQPTITPAFITALKEHGYFDSNATIIKLSLSMAALRENPVFSFKPTPRDGISFGSDEVSINDSRVHKSRLYVPGLTRFEETSTIDTKPHLHVYTTASLKTQAIADLKQGMRAIITRKKAEAERLIATLDDALYKL